MTFLLNVNRNTFSMQKKTEFFDCKDQKRRSNQYIVENILKLFRHILNNLSRID